MNHPKLKKFKLHSSPPPTERHIINLMALQALEKFGKVSNTAGRCMFKSTVPATRQGETLAETRNNINRVNLYLRALLAD